MYSLYSNEFFLVFSYENIKILILFFRLTRINLYNLKLNFLTRSTRIRDDNYGEIIIPSKIIDKIIDRKSLLFFFFNILSLSFSHIILLNFVKIINKTIQIYTSSK
jgi:hypothetical protein